MDCETCKVNKMSVEPVPYIVHESAMARQERTIKRLWIALILVICLLVATNGAWIAYEAQFETVTVTQEVEQEAENGVNHFVGGDFFGETESTDYDYPENP